MVLRLDYKASDLQLIHSGNDRGSPEAQPVEDWPDIPCHCQLCLPCSSPCCENPAVRAGRCCDPRTLGHCLQPYEVSFIAWYM